MAELRLRGKSGPSIGDGERQQSCALCEFTGSIPCSRSEWQERRAAPQHTGDDHAVVQLARQDFANSASCASLTLDRGAAPFLAI